MLSQTSLYTKPKETIVARLSLISLMDIFTILVFFLMLNSGETQNIDVDRFVTLPDSVSGEALRDELSIIVDDQSIIYDGEIIAEVGPILSKPKNRIEPLGQLLIEHTEKLGDLAKAQRKAGHAITIMADKSVNYALLQSIMDTCREENYRNISLAVNYSKSDNVFAETPGANQISYRGE